MKSLKHLPFLILTMVLLAACGSVPTDGLTSFMSASETEQTLGENSLGYETYVVSQCDGVLDPVNNTMRLSFQLEKENPVFGAEQNIFGGGTRLLAELPGSPEANVRFRCNGAAEIAALPLKVNGQTVSWLAALKTSGLELEAPSGATQTVEAITLDGMLAPSAGDLNIMFETLYGGDFSNGFQSYYAMQKALYLNYPDSGFMMGQALNAGQSEENAALWGQIYTETDVATQRRLLVQTLTSPENEAIAAQAVAATVKTMGSMGFDASQISAQFDEQTNGRITVDLSKISLDSLPDVTFEVTSRDDSGNVEFTAQSQESGSESGGSPGSEGGAEDPPTDPPSDPPSDPEPPSDPPSDPEPPSDPPTDPGGNTGGGIWDLFWNIFQGAAAGATLGALAGPEGAIIGAEAGGAAGAFNWYMNSGVWDPDPNDPNSPCNSPILNC